MCDCQDDINSIEISSGPQGPKGDPGNTPIISGTSLSNLSILTGLATFTTQTGISWTVGERIRATNNDASKIMEGPVVSYTSTTLVLNINYIKGTGSNSSWNLSICGEVGQTGLKGDQGEVGQTGITGGNAYGMVTQYLGSGAVPNSYRFRVGSSAWMAFGQVLYLEPYGYFKVIETAAIDEVTVLNESYTGNTVGFSPPFRISPGGIQGRGSFIYETTDGNQTAAQGHGPYSVLVRNPSDTGYVFMTPLDFKTYLNSI